MSLTSSLSVALSGLTTSSEQLAVVSRNVARANEDGATRKVANVSTTDSGGARVASVTRLANPSLLAKVTDATSAAAAQKVISASLDQFNYTVNDPSLEGSPSALLGKLDSALQTFGAAPQDTTASNAAISAARDMAQGLRDATQSVQNQRSLADRGISGSVDNINSLLAQFQTLNDEIVSGSGMGKDVTDSLDQRDLIVQKLAEEIGIRTVTDGNNSMSIFTDQGVTLFNNIPRAVTFTAIPAFGANTTGNAVYVDGVPITGGVGSMQSLTGRLVGYAEIRDTLGPTYQNQLDELARGLISAFAEQDPSGDNVLTAQVGLFTYDGAPALPTSGTVSAGIAGTIAINPVADPSKGGDALTLRDGGMNGASYVYNTTNATGYATRLQQLIDNMSTAQPYDQAAKLTNSATIYDFASASAGWLQSQRQTSTTAADYNTTLQQRAADTLSKETGVNIDEEMTNMLQFERAYQASARLMNTIDALFQTLLQTYSS
ncbi:MAG: flagellar hook-associated protein FlgK [Hyphomicrobiaceae bacterium]|nr:flagellar hook-associated protein FlgK [Hyphomicrobiaceae bacterium]